MTAAQRIEGRKQEKERTFWPHRYIEARGDKLKK